MKLSSLSTVLFRKKQFEGGSHLDSKLKRCLTIFDVMFIAIGHMIGAGIYVLTGSVVRNQAGPAIILSFIFSGFAALLSAFSYAEFGARFIFGWFGFQEEVSDSHEPAVLTLTVT